MLANISPPMTCDRSVTRQSALRLCSGENLKLHRAPLVLIHGWGANSQIWQSLPEALGQYFDVYTLDLPGFGSAVLEEYSEQSLVDWLHTQLPERCYLVGLSLGGMLCRAYAAQYPKAVRAMVTISTNLRFVANRQYASAMCEADFTSFSCGWDRDPQLCLKRFAGLQSQGDLQQRQLIRQLRNMDMDFDPVGAGSLLDLLASLDTTEYLQNINCPSLAIFGGQDCLVPVESANQLPDSCTKVIIDKAGHLPHLSFQSQVVEEIYQFIEDQLYKLDKSQVAQSFGRAADHYDEAAIVQRWSGRQLQSRMEATFMPRTVVDLGCGTGTQLFDLKQQFPNASCLGVDFSREMLVCAQSKYSDQPIDWLCCDAESMALQDGSRDLVVSNFALQWCANPSRVMSEIYRVLGTGGRFYFAIPGPNTLCELRNVWAQIDEDIHINRFFHASHWQKALQNAGFAQIDLSSETKVEHHQSVRDLLLNLKTVGATNYNRGRALHLTGKSHIAELYKGYEQYRTARGTIPATWDIVFGCAVK